MLEVWFVNVGHGDCTIIRFPSGRIMMVDINNCRALDLDSVNEIYEEADAKSALGAFSRLGDLQRQFALEDCNRLLDDPIDVLKRECPGSGIFRFVATHPDMDHLTGLYRLSQQEPGIGIYNFWDTRNNKRTPDGFKRGEDDRDWEEYQRLRASTGQPKVLFLNRADNGNFWTDDGVTILSPTPEIVRNGNEREDWNHFSYVLHIQHGKSSLILPGDTSITVQEELAGLLGSPLKSSILKAPHHGRDSGYCNEFVRLVKPDYTIVSVGKKPDSDASNKYRQHSKKVYSTRFQGTIYAQLFDDGHVHMYNYNRDRIDLAAEAEANLLMSFARTTN